MDLVGDVLGLVGMGGGSGGTGGGAGGYYSVDKSAHASGAANITDNSTRGVTWPVVLIGGLLIVGLNIGIILLVKKGKL